MSERFLCSNGLRHGCVMSLSFNIHMDGVIIEIKYTSIW